MLLRYHVIYQKTLEKAFHTGNTSDPKASDTEKVNDQNFVKTKRVYGRKKHCLLKSVVKNLSLMRNVFLKICEGKVTHRRRQRLKHG